MADERGDLEVEASWHIDDVPPQQDRIPPQQDRIPPQQDRIPPQFDRVPTSPPEPPQQPAGAPWRHVRGVAKALAVTALLVATLTFGLVEPLRMLNHGWSSAQHVLGSGGGRGVFTVSACGASHTDSNDTTYWDCTGVFSQSGAAPVQVSVYDKHHDRAGGTRKAYSESDGSIGLAEPNDAGLLLGWWATLAMGVFLVEAAVPISLAGWILGKCNLREAGALAASIVVIGGIVLAMLCFFVIAGLAIAFNVVQS